MKVAIVADVHVANHRTCGGELVSGVNRRARRCLDTLGRAINKAEAEGVGLFVVAGDLLDVVRPEAQLLAELQELFRGTDMRVVLLLGNHEQESSRLGDHALGPLAPVATVVERPAVIDSILFVPYAPGLASETLASAVKHASQGVRGLVCHAGLRCADTPPWLMNARDSVDSEWLVQHMKAYGIQYGFAGNWHERRVHTTRPVWLEQVGALVPTGWDNPGFKGYGSLVVWDQEQRRCQVFVIDGPRFVKATSVEQLGAMLKEHPNCTDIMARVSVLPADLENERAAGITLIQAVKPRHLQLFVEPDASFAEAEARVGARQARSAETLEEACAAFVGSMVLEPGVSRDAVAEHVRRFLR